MEVKYNGNTLIELGFTPNKHFKDILKDINDNAIPHNELFDYVSNLMPLPIEMVEPHAEPLRYFENIETTNIDEENNLLSIRDTMNVLMTTPTVIGGAIMPDACPTGEKGQIPVGGVVVTENTIHPSMHSADVCCSMMSTDLGKINPQEVMDIAFTTTQFGAGGRKGHGGWENILYDNKFLTDKILGNYFTKDYIVKAAKHIGTQGDGNHFLFVGISENTGNTHLVTHHGSRGFGASVYKKGMDVAEKFRRKLSPNTLKRNAWIPYDELEGQLYWDALQIVRDWTKLNHESIHNKICDKLKIQYHNRFWNEHNFVFKDGNKFYHAKGATPLDNKFVPDSQNGLRLIPLNMSQPILVVKGNATESNLGFAPHGAGRNISRSEHHRRNSHKTNEEIFKRETKGLDVRFFSGKIDISELPSAYKNADNVIEQMEKFGLGEVVDKILPFGCIMAGEEDRPIRKKSKH